MPAPWCGKIGTSAWVASTLNPCFFNTGAAVVLAVAAAAFGYAQATNARRLSLAARGRTYLLARPSASAAHLQVAAAGVLLALHGFALLWSTTQVPQPPFIDFSEALLITAWTLFLVSSAFLAAPPAFQPSCQPARLPAAASCSLSCSPAACACRCRLPVFRPSTPLLLPTQGLLFYCRRLGVVPRVKPLLWLAAVLYAFGLYSEACCCCLPATACRFPGSAGCPGTSRAVPCASRAYLSALDALH
jgi:hypothetical protein